MVRFVLKIVYENIWFLLHKSDKSFFPDSPTLPVVIAYHMKVFWCFALDDGNPLVLYN